MSLDYISLLKNFQPVIASYQDVSAIYTKLFTQGQLQKLAGAITEIYDEEHVFTLTELQKYCQENNQKEDDFVAEQYELNSNIFRRNLTLIVQNLVEEIGKKVLERFREDYSNGVSTEESSLKHSQNVDQPIQETVAEKHQYKSHMPEIQEEVESANKVNAKIAKSEVEQASANNKSFELNISDLMQKPREEQQLLQERIVMAQNPYENNQVNYQRQVPVPTPQQKPSSSASSSKQRQEQYKQQNSQSTNNNSRSEEYNQYDHETGTFRVNQDKFHNTPQQFNNQQNWSSPVRTVNHVNQQRRGARSPPNQRSIRDNSTEKYDRKSTSMMLNSYSRWSNSNGKPDPSILDSEFSYGQGQSFSRSPKAFHHRINNVPGPGEYEQEDSTQMTRPRSPDHSFARSPKGFHHKINTVPGPGEYEAEEGTQYTRPRSPDHSFSKSPKKPSYFKESKVPGAIYYPTKHFLSNSK